MDNLNLLLDDRDTFLKLALEKYNKTDEDLNNYLSVIQEWINTQNCIPEIPHANFIINFLLMNKFDIKSTQEKLKMYYSIRTIFPEFFQNKHPSSSHMQEVANKMYYIPLPKLTDEGYRVAIVKFVDDKPENFQVYNFFAHTYNVTEVRLHEDVTFGDYLIYDLGNLKVGHFFKLSPMVLRKTTIILEKVFSNRVKQIHILNSPKYAATTIFLAKQLMKPKIASRIHVHKKVDSIFKHISPKIMPKDYGGEEFCLADLNKLWKAKLAKYKERFDALDGIRISAEPERRLPITTDQALGFQGNFRKLEVD